MSGSGELFEGLAEDVSPRGLVGGAPRLRRPERQQIGWQQASIDELVSADHPVRAIWGLVSALDLGELHDRVKAREGVPGQAPPAPELMLALWLWATIEGVGSARLLARLCEQHLAYRWLCGGVSMNYHGLSDFRTAHSDVLERLLARGVAALVAEGLVSLEVLGQDGIKVRAAAGAGSFRRRRRLEALEEAARARVERLRGELQTDASASEQRKRAAQARAGRERVERIAAAKARMADLEAERTRREKTNKTKVAKQKEPRASTTDAEARVMKMADGGFRPAYNGQIVSTPGTQIIVGIDVETTGSDRGLARSALEALRRGGIEPSDYLVDGGFTKNDDIEWAHERAIRMLCPPTHNKHDTDPFAMRPKDGPGMIEWRTRMASEAGQALYKERAKIECSNAWARRMGLSRLLVRGKQKVRAVLLWFALAHNMLRTITLRRAALALAAV